jgi:phosphoserine phosphatase
MPPPRYAFFDLDGTLLPWDTQFLFCDFVLRSEPWRRFLLVPVLFAVPLRAVGLIRTRFLKRLFLGFLAGLRPGDILSLSEAFAEEIDRRWIWPGMRLELEARRREGCVLVLNTASPGFYADALARRLGFHHCLGTEVPLPTPGMPWPPAFSGPNNKREAKVSAMRARGPLGPDTLLPVPGSWAYTDSVADLPLLACAEHPVLVHPRPAMAALGRERGWTILEPGPPVSRRERILAAIAIFFGCWHAPRQGISLGS